MVEQAEQLYPATDSLQAIPGVGPTVPSSFVLSIEDPNRLRRSRSVPDYPGLRPNLPASTPSAEGGSPSREIGNCAACSSRQPMLTSARTPTPRSSAGPKPLSVASANPRRSPP